MKSCLEKNHNSRAHDGQNTHSWCATCSKRAAHLARTLLSSPTGHQGGEGEKKGSEMTLQLPVLSSLGAATQRHENTREQKQGSQCRPARDPSSLRRLESQALESAFQPQRWRPYSTGCKLPAVSSFHSNAELGPVKEEMGWLVPDPLPGWPGRSLKESGPGLYFSPPNAKPWITKCSSLGRPGTSVGRKVTLTWSFLLLCDEAT